MFCKSADVGGFVYIYMMIIKVLVYFLYWVIRVVCSFFSLDVWI